MKEIYKIFIALIFLLFLSIKSLNIKIEESTERWLPKGSKEIEYYRKFLKNFPSDAILIISIENKNFKKDSLIEFSNRIKGVKGVYEYPIPILKQKFINTDLKTFILFYEPKSALSPSRPEIIEKVESYLKNKGLKYHIAGTGVIFSYLSKEIKREVPLIFSISLVILSILIILITRNIKSLIYILLSASGGLFVMFFVSTILKIPISSLSLVLIPIVLFYNSTICFHIISKEGNFKRVLRPSLFATLTTIAGFSTFLLSDIPLLKDFSKLAISGILGSSAFIFTIFYPQTKLKGISKVFLRMKISDYSIKKRIIPVSLLFLLFLSIPFIKNLRFETNTLRILPANSKPYIDHKVIEEKVGYYTPVEYVFPIDVQPSKLRKFIDKVYRLKEVGGYISPFNFYPFFINPKKGGYISKDGKYMRITFFIKLMPTLKGINLVKGINKIADSLGLKSYTVTGYVTLYARIAYTLSNTFFKSLMLAFGAIFLIFLLYFRNSKIFLLSILSNIFPIFMLFLSMSILKVSLDIFTIPIASILLGIVVDDTFYILYFFKKYKDIKKAYSLAEPPGFLTSFILFASFLIPIFSHLPPVKNFGLLCSLSIFFAYLGDFVILPFLLKIFFR